jgi:hypothetical protein
MNLEVLYIAEQKYLMGPTPLKASSNSEGILKPRSGDNSVRPCFTGMEVPLKPDKHMFHKPTWVKETVHVQLCTASPGTDSLTNRNKPPTDQYIISAVKNTYLKPSWHRTGTTTVTSPTQECEYVVRGSFTHQESNPTKTIPTSTPHNKHNLT